MQSYSSTKSSVLEYVLLRSEPKQSQNNWSGTKIALIPSRVNYRKRATHLIPSVARDWMPSNERRASIRVEKRLAIEYSSNSPPIKAFVEDLSEVGMYIDVDLALPAGNTMEFSLFLPDGDAETPVKGGAVVVWSGPTGMGVEFTDLSDAARERIHFFVAAVLFDQPPDLPPS